MANRFSPICLPMALHKLPLRYASRLRKLYGERGYSAKEHLGWFSDWADLEEVYHDDVKVRLFTQTLLIEGRKWYKNLADDSILNYQSFEDAFKDKWEYQKNPKQYLS